MSKHPADTYSLVADIGGTNTRVALAEGADVHLETVRRYRNADHPELAGVQRITLWESFKYAGLQLWCPERRKLISFRELPR